MKTNLKNRPNFLSAKYESYIEKFGKEEAHRSFIIDEQDWFDKFEKELTEILVHDELDNPKSPTLQNQNKIRIELLQEILGEKP